MSVMRDARDRYVRLPPWVLIVQLFLGIGWFRAGVAHSINGDWWTGDELVTFLADRAGDALPLYGLLIDLTVDRLPNGFAAVVLLAEIGVGLALIINTKPLEALTVGCFLNLNFIAAGEVNPSIFYLLLSLSVIAWLLESRLSAERTRSLAGSATIIGSIVVVVLVFAIDTLSPKSVIGDPASVLILVTALVVGALWASCLRRQAAAPNTSSDRFVWSTAQEVVAEVEERTGYAFTVDLHTDVAVDIGVQPSLDVAPRTTRSDFALYITEVGRYLYSRAWIEALVDGLSTADGFEELVGQPPRRLVAMRDMSIDLSRDPTVELLIVPEERTPSPVG